MVDVTHFAKAGTHYALNLPIGIYDLLVLADTDGNQILDQSEVVGLRKVDLREIPEQEKVLTDFDINLSGKLTTDWNINIPIPETAIIQKSLFYPQGTIRQLDDPIFDDEVATIGMYEPAAFLEKSPTMFYATEEYLRYKIPVIFVHGISATPRQFIPIIEQLDRDRYVPWFFYYPSGADLGQLGENFHRLFWSGKLFPKTDIPMIVVAHSMGGLVSKLQTLDSGNQFWETLSERPFAELNADQEIREGLAKTFFFDPDPSVQRVITIGTPHRIVGRERVVLEGAGVSSLILARPLGAGWVSRLP